MFECIYTKDKIKKSKSWKDGYIAIKQKLIFLYDDEKKKIYSFAYRTLEEEMNTPGYLIYCENIKNYLKDENGYDVCNNNISVEKNDLPENKNAGRCVKLKQNAVRNVDYGSGENKKHKVFNVDAVEGIDSDFAQNKCKGRSNEEIKNLFK